MSLLPISIVHVIESFEKLPGIGPKSAQRLAFYLLHMPTEEVERFSDALKNLKHGTVLCSVCKNVTESDPCMICSSPTRDHSVICVVEQPTDVLAVEKTGAFHGVYHVLHGSIDPLNNIGPDEIYISDLLKRIKHSDKHVTELIFAMNPTMEGEATSMYIQKQLSAVSPQLSDLKITRLAHGLPIGADIEYADEITLKRAMEGRREY
jgi:recombination protein RecR